MRLATLTSTLLFVGCANTGDEGMIVLNNTAVEGDSCALTGDPGQPFVSHGQIYALSNQGYTLTPLIQSRVTTEVSSGSGSSATIDPLTKTVFLRGADVKLTIKAVEIEQGGQFTVTQPETALPPFSVLFSGALPPDGSVNVGFEVITAAQLRTIVQMSGANLDAQNLNAEILAEVTIRGDLNGDDISSSPFFFPISVCTDCVVVNNGACPMLTAPRTGNACNIFQDGVVDCCEDAGGLLCPAPMGTP